MWEVGVPKVGTPSSQVTSHGPLFIGDVPTSWLLWFLVETREEGCGKHKKNFEKKERKNWVAKVARRVVRFSASVARVS